MAQITATMVKQLRDRTGQAIMDCKKALIETDGDIEKAIDLLRKKGMAILDKRGERETKEGKVVGLIGENGKVAVLASLCSETDFTSKNELFRKVAQTIAQGLLEASVAPDSAEGLGKLETSDGKKLGDAVNDLISQIGEKITIGPFTRFDLDGPGLLHCYVHFNGKIGTLVQIDAENEQAASAHATKTLISDVAMHITATNPTAVSNEEIDPELVEREKEIARSQVVGKPENMIEQIVNGKLNKWYKQVVLLQQPFVKDDSKTVSQLVDELSKTVGGKLTIKRFYRLQIG